MSNSKTEHTGSTGMATERGFGAILNEKSTVVQADIVDFGGLVQGLRQAFNTGKTKSVEWRRRQLQQIQRMCKEQHESITEAVRKDHNGYKMRGVIEMAPLFEEASNTLMNLEKWASPQAVSSGMVPTTKAAIRPEPKGVVLIIAPWNYPIALALQPLVSALAAGNCCVIKPSEVSSHSGLLIQRLVQQYLDPECDLDHQPPSKLNHLFPG